MSHVFILFKNLTEISGTDNNNNVCANSDNLFIHIFSHNGVKKQKLQNINHNTLRKAGLSYEVVKAGPLCGKS